MVRGVLSLVVLLLALLVTAPAHAGGAAIITLDELPGEIRAGETVWLDFVVRQHGIQPVDEFEGVGPVEPILIATYVESGETLRALAWKPEAAEAGRFAVEVSFPLEGMWDWRIEPAPFYLMNPFELLNILPAAAPSPAEANAQPVFERTAVQTTFRLLGVLFLLGAVALATLRWRASRRGETLTVGSSFLPRAVPAATGMPRLHGPGSSSLRVLPISLPMTRIRPSSGAGSRTRRPFGRVQRCRISI